MNVQTESQSEIITEEPALHDICRRVEETGWFAFDTEFVGEDQFRPEICVIQAASDGFCALIDPLSGLETKRFWELIADPYVLVIVHAGAEDIGQCPREIGRPPQNVFDLQTAAGLAGLGYPLSLSRLVRIITHRKLHKSQTLTDWRRRPLTGEQISYAIEDVAHLREIYDSICARLDKLGRASWAREECTAMCSAAVAEEAEAQQLRRLKGSGSLGGRELAIAHALLDTREALAREYNRPVRTVVKDHLLVEIARRGWTNAKRIRSLRGMSLSAAAAQRLADAVAAAKGSPPETWPQVPSQEDSPREETLIALLTAVLRDYCDRNALAYSLLSKKQDLRALVRAYTRPEEDHLPSALRTGWRKEAVGDLLADILAGRKHLRVTSRDSKLGLHIE